MKPVTACFVASTCLAVGMLAGIPALALFADKIAGEWRGEFANSLGEHGGTLLSIEQRDDGSLVGSWDGVDIRGKWVSGDALELHGRSTTRDYEIKVTIRYGVMSMTYLAKRLNAPGSYQGRATLQPYARPASLPNAIPNAGDPSGEWRGPFQNSTGDRGETLLSLELRPDGTIHGSWDGVEVQGGRPGSAGAKLVGQTATRQYEIVIRTLNNTMTMTYSAKRLDAPGTYRGEATLQRTRQ